MSNTNNLTNARINKKDEFYTQYCDIEKEVQYHKEYLLDKIVYCNCDEAYKSNFFNYFYDNFDNLKLKKLITSSISNDKAYYYTYDGNELYKFPLSENGDFRSEECTELLKQSDVVITNPPFSLFNEYIKLLAEYDKKFLVVGNQNAITAKHIFPLIKSHKIYVSFGFKGNVGFFNHGGYEDYAKATEHKENMIRVSGVVWYTNLNMFFRTKKLELTKSYSPEEYPEYDNFNAINVNKTKDIPKDYEGVMGVPITFLNKYNPEQFEILGKVLTPFLNNNKLYKRLLIKKL